MGYQVERFTHPPPNEFFCGVCKDVLEDAVQTPCDHCFCSACIQPTISSSLDCPQCHSRVLANQLKPVMRVFRNMLKSQSLRCVFVGCGAFMKLEQIAEHEQACPFGPSNCPHGNCPYARGTHLSLQRQDRHKHLETCEYRSIECSQGCGVRVEFANLSKHIKKCSSNPVFCECGQQVPPKLLSDHKAKECSLTEITCDIPQCIFSAKRGDHDAWEQHAKSAALQHTHCLAVALKTNNAKLIHAQTLLQDKTNEIQQIRAVLQKTRIKNLHNLMSNEFTVTWIVTEFVHKWGSPSTIVQSPALTFTSAPHPKHRYTIQIFLSVNMNNDGQLGLSFVLCGGDSPDNLHWPMSRTLTFLCVHTRGGDDATKHMRCETIEELKHLDVAPDSSFKSNMFGWREFLSKDQVESGHFLHNDCLIVQCVMDGDTFL
eukprot:c23586_g1_i1.p1 GENE.c23586_g1_i1~~c23586_g1_i1.p1  ORF type:complete len:447 (+),score=69.24 c23586_g1_i1:55-1341(+)